SRLRVHLFFQAANGIRSRNVTGVQTCALPIYVELLVQVLPRPRHQDVRSRIVDDGLCFEPNPLLLEEVFEVVLQGMSGTRLATRSEERRVGREWSEGEVRWCRKREQGSPEGAG